MGCGKMRNYTHHSWSAAWARSRGQAEVGSGRVVDSAGRLISVQLRLMVLRPLEERPERRLINRSDVSEAVGHEPAARHPGALVGHDAFVEQSRGLFAVCDHERLRSEKGAQVKPLRTANQ